MSPGATPLGPARNSTTNAAQRTQTETLRVGLTFVFRYMDENLPSLLSFFNEPPDETVGSDYMDAKNMLYLAVKSSRLPMPSIDKMIRLPKNRVYCYWEFKDKDSSSSKTRSCVSAAVAFVKNVKSYLNKRNEPMETAVGKIICVVVHDIHVGSYDGFESLPDFASSTAIGREEFWLDKRNLSSQGTATFSIYSPSSEHRLSPRDFDTENSTGPVGVSRRPGSSGSPHLHTRPPYHAPDPPYSVSSRISISPSATVSFGSSSSNEPIRLNPLKRLRIDDESKSNKLVVLDNRSLLPKTGSAQSNDGRDWDGVEYYDAPERLRPISRDSTLSLSHRGPMLHSPRNILHTTSYASSSSSSHAPPISNSSTRSSEAYTLTNFHHFNAARAQQPSTRLLEGSAKVPSPQNTNDHVMFSKGVDELVSQSLAQQAQLDQLLRTADSERSQPEREINEENRLQERADMKERDHESRLDRHEKGANSELYSELCAAVARQETLEVERRSFLEELGKTTDAWKEAEESHTQTVIQLKQIIKERDDVNKLLETVQSKATFMEEQGNAIKGKLSLLSNRIQSSIISRKFENGDDSRLAYNSKISRDQVDLRKELDAMKTELEICKESNKLEVSERKKVEQEMKDLKEELERANSSRRDMETALSKESCMRMAAEWVILDIKCSFNQDLRLSTMDSLRDFPCQCEEPRRTVRKSVSDSKSQSAIIQNEILSS